MLNQIFYFFERILIVRFIIDLIFHEYFAKKSKKWSFYFSTAILFILGKKYFLLSDKNEYLPLIIYKKFKN